MTMDAGSAGIGTSGYTLDDLSAYLDRGRTPAIAAIYDSPECQAMLSSMERVGSLARDLLARDVLERPALEESWVGVLLSSISREIKAGRDIPLTSSDPHVTLTVTEGAVRELVRAAGDSVDGVLVGSCFLDGDVTAPGSGIRVTLSISVVPDRPVQDLAAMVRQRVFSELLSHTELTVQSIDVTVVDVHLQTKPIDEGGH